MDEALASATGQALALLAAALEARGLMDGTEFAQLLGTLAVVAAETSERQGDYLGAWAGMIRDASRSRD